MVGFVLKTAAYTIFAQLRNEFRINLRQSVGQEKFLSVSDFVSDFVWENQLQSPAALTAVDSE
jgi:hypothetical protein